MDSVHLIYMFSGYFALMNTSSAKSNIYCNTSFVNYLYIFIAVTESYCYIICIFTILKKIVIIFIDLTCRI